jgi:hypothetical protein
MNRPSDKALAEQIAQANGTTIARLGLRFDKVVLRLMENLLRALDGEVPAQTMVTMTMTAPIKLPAKTEQETLAHIRDLLHKKKSVSDLTFFENSISIRIISNTQDTREFLGLVHNPDVDAHHLLNMIEAWYQH